eukprot:799174_1
MDSLNPRITNNSSRPEIDHSKSSDNVLLKLNIDSYSEPMHYDYHTANKLQNNENISTQPQISTTHNKNRLEISFNEFVDTHRQFSFTNANNKKRKSHDNNEGFEPIDDSDEYGEYDDRESSCEPSPTPIVSDLDELLADTPNMQRMADTPDTNAISGPSFPVHGISIPYIDSDNDESDTPEPCDTPLSVANDIININNQCPYGTAEEIKLSSEDDSNSDIDYDQFITEDNMDNMSYHAALSPKSKSWQKITMTRMNYKRCKRIKCITPITQEMAEWKLNNMNTRRRSVANITPSVHKLFKLDDDLLKIREEYLARTNKSSDHQLLPPQISHIKKDTSSDQLNDTNHNNNSDKTNSKPMPVSIQLKKIQIPK